MKAACQTCGHIHAPDDAVAVGRFDPTGLSGYRMRGVVEAPLRATRGEAAADACAARVLRQERVR